MNWYIYEFIYDFVFYDSICTIWYTSWLIRIFTTQYVYDLISLRFDKFTICNVFRVCFMVWYILQKYFDRNNLIFSSQIKRNLKNENNCILFTMKSPWNISFCIFCKHLHNDTNALVINRCYKIVILYCMNEVNAIYNLNNI